MGSPETAKLARAPLARSSATTAGTRLRRSLDDERDLRCPDRSRRERAQVQHPCDERVGRGAGERPAREDERGHRQPESDAPCFAAAPEDRAAVPLPGAEDQRSGRTLCSEPADRDRLPRHGDPERLGELARRPAVVAHPQPRDRLRVPACVAGGRAERDDRLAAHECLEARDTGGRMDDCVGRGHQLVHVVRETEDARARLAGEVSFEPVADLLVQAADADDVRTLQLERGAHCALELADAPAAAGDEDERPLFGEAEPAARVRLLHGLEELLLHEGAHDARASRPGDALHPADAGIMHDEVEIHPWVRPERVDAEVAHRRQDGDLQRPAAAEVPEDAGGGGVRRHDHVRFDPVNQAQQRLRAEERQSGTGDRAAGREAREEEAFEPVRPGETAKLDAVDVPAHERDHPADVLERVLDDDLRRLGLQLGFERAGDCAVSLALFRGEDEDAATRLRRRVGRRFEHDGLAHGPDLLPKAGRRQPQRLSNRRIYM